MIDGLIFNGENQIRLRNICKHLGKMV